MAKNLLTHKNGTPWLSRPAMMLRIEGAALLLATVTVYLWLGFRIWYYPLFLLTPDLSMLAYLFGAQAGSQGYNLVHTTLLPLALGAGSLLLGWNPGIMAALIWLGHIGMDRMFGYGLKLPTGFKHTHLDNLSAGTQAG